MDIVWYTMLACLMIGITILEWWRWSRDLPPQPLAAVLITVIVVPLCFLKVRRLQKRSQSLRLGRDGERIVGQALEELRENGYAIFHDIVGTDFNVDHVIVSRHGIFAIETKTWSKPRWGKARVDFDGKKATLMGKQLDGDPIRQAIAGAEWIRRDIVKKSTGKDFNVTAVVVFPGWWVDDKNNSKRIWVLNPDQLAFKILQEPESLSQEDAHLVAYHLSRFVRTSG